MKARVLLGMSGGVDSSVAAWLLKEEGYEVVGVTMKVWPQDCLSRAEDKCCGPQAIADARGVAYALGIPHYVVDEAADFERMVIEYFSNEYKAGRTPNPCVMCNEKVKFGKMLSKADDLGAEFIATGHYARIEKGPEGYRLGRAVDVQKDQSYFLFSLGQDRLRRSLMPLGRLTKPEVREVARKLGLKVYDKEDSQEICFVPGNDYKAFLRSHLGEKEFHPGGIYDRFGNRLGEHEGIEFYTIGQRKGLGGGSARPRYVIDIDPETSSVIVGEAEDLLSEGCWLANSVWHEGALEGPRRVTVKIRYHHPGTSAVVEPEAGRADRLRVWFDEPQRAVTPGQAAVIYDGDWVLGGGWIERAAQPSRQPA